MPASPLVDLVEHIARSLVDQPDEVEVHEVQDGDTTVLELHVAKDDLGKVIGKQGNTARAIRSVLAAACTKQRRRAVLDILED